MNFKLGDSYLIAIRKDLTSSLVIISKFCSSKILLEPGNGLSIM